MDVSPTFTKLQGIIEFAVFRCNSTTYIFGTIPYVNMFMKYRNMNLSEKNCKKKYSVKGLENQNKKIIGIFGRDEKKRKSPKAKTCHTQYPKENQPNYRLESLQMKGFKQLFALRKRFQIVFLSIWSNFIEFTRKPGGLNWKYQTGFRKLVT